MPVWPGGSKPSAYSPPPGPSSPPAPTFQVTIPLTGEQLEAGDEAALGQAVQAAWGQQGMQGGSGSSPPSSKPLGGSGGSPPSSKPPGGNGISPPSSKPPGGRPTAMAPGGGGGASPASPAPNGGGSDNSTGLQPTIQLVQAADGTWQLVITFPGTPEGKAAAQAMVEQAKAPGSQLVQSLASAALPSGAKPTVDTQSVSFQRYGPQGAPCLQRGGHAVTPTRHCHCAEVPQLC